MDFVDWRKAPDKQKLFATIEEKQAKHTYSRRFSGYVEEIIIRAQERGEFDNLPGMGKPLQLDDESAAGDNALAYHLLKSHGYAPLEIELAREIRTERERIEARIARVIHRGRSLRARRVPPFPGEKRAFNHLVEKTAREYAETLRSLNSRILTLNLTAPSQMHQPMLEVDQQVKKFREACPMFQE
jgi:DnaJ family protein C protein 28